MEKLGKDEKMKGIHEIEVEDEDRWHEYSDFKGEADDFVIRIKKDKEN